MGETGQRGAAGQPCESHAVHHGKFARDPQTDGARDAGAGEHDGSGRVEQAVQLAHHRGAGEAQQRGVSGAQLSGTRAGLANVGAGSLCVPYTRGASAAKQ